MLADVLAEASNHMVDENYLHDQFQSQCRGIHSLFFIVFCLISKDDLASCNTLYAAVGISLRRHQVTLGDYRLRARYDRNPGPSPRTLIAHITISSPTCNAVISTPLCRRPPLSPASSLLLKCPLLFV